MKKGIPIYRLRPDEKPSAGLRRIFRSMRCCVFPRLHARSAPSSGAVHELRQDIKRVRALAWWLKPLLSKTKKDRVATALREAAHALAGSRRRVVLRSTLLRLGKKASDQSQANAVTELLASADDIRPQPIPRPAFARAARRFMAALDLLTTELAGIQSAPRSKKIKTAARGAKKFQKKALASRDDAALHTWRKKIKRLQYLLETFEIGSGKKTARQMKRLDRLQNQLGLYHDLVSAQSWVSQHSGEALPEKLARPLQSLLQKRKARRLKKVRTLAG